MNYLQSSYKRLPHFFTFLRSELLMNEFETSSAKECLIRFKGREHIMHAKPGISISSTNNETIMLTIFSLMMDGIKCKEH